MIPTSLKEWNEYGRDAFPGLVGLEITSIEPGEVTARLPVRPELLTPHGFLHAASVVALVDTICGYGCLRSLPEGGESFTTIELKSNFLGTAGDGAVVARAWLVHGGRMTQVWDADASHDTSGRTLALFRCTQMVLYPR